MGQLGWGEIAVIILVAFIVIGPTKLPQYAAEAGKMLRQLRQMARDASAGLRDELGPEYADMSLRDMHPRALVRKHLLDDMDDPAAPMTTTSPTAEAAEPATRPLAAGERPPYDADAT